MPLSQVAKYLTSTEFNFQCLFVRLRQSRELNVAIGGQQMKSYQTDKFNGAEYGAHLIQKAYKS